VPYVPPKCLCGAVKGTLVTWVHWPERVEEFFGREHIWPEVNIATRACVDRAACDARQVKRAERGRQRAQCIVLAEPKAPDAPRGTCRWCGEPIWRVPPREEWEGDRDRRFHYHRGENGDPDCLREWNRSRVWNGRDLIHVRGDPCCVDCGTEDPRWEADHEVALEDGGEHVQENIVRRCVPCHRAKTARENAARARRRRDEGSGQMALA
jgi:5-methylcytosine-specific restriction endonuclease McrA